MEPHCPGTEQPALAAGGPLSARARVAFMVQMAACTHRRSRTQAKGEQRQTNWVQAQTGVCSTAGCESVTAHGTAHGTQHRHATHHTHQSRKTVCGGNQSGSAHGEQKGTLAAHSGSTWAGASVAAARTAAGGCERAEEPAAAFRGAALRPLGIGAYGTCVAAHPTPYPHTRMHMQTQAAHLM